MESKSWYVGSRPSTHAEQTSKMKALYRVVMENDKQARRQKIAAIKQRRADGLIDSEDEQFELD